MTLFQPERRDAVATGSPTYNPFENPAVPLASVGFDNVWSTENDSGETVTIDRALVVPTVYRCISLISTVVASCPIEVYRKKDNEPINNPLFDSANQAMTYTQYELWELVAAHLASFGDSFVLKKRDSYDRIIDLKPIYPGLVEVKIDPDTKDKIFLVRHVNDDGTADMHTKPQVFTDFEIMHIPGLGLSGLGGLSPIMQMQQTVGTALAADRLAGRFYKGGTQLGGIIKIKAPLKSQAQAEGVKARWMNNNAGVGNAGNVAVLDAETDFQSITIPPDQLQFLESRRWQTTEIARMFGIPPHLVGDVEKSTSWGTGIEQQNIGFVAYTIASYTNRIEQRVTREVVSTRGQCAEFNLDRLMRGSMSERFLAYQQALGAGWISADEIRVKENMNPLGGKFAKPFPPAGATQPMDGDDQGDEQDDPSEADNSQPQDDGDK